MSLSSYEVAMQTMGSVFSGYLEDKNGVPVITNDGLDQLVKEQFPHWEKEEIRPGFYRIRIPPNETCPGYSPLSVQAVPRFPGDANVRLTPKQLEIFSLLGEPKEFGVTIEL